MDIIQKIENKIIDKHQEGGNLQPDFMDVDEDMDDDEIKIIRTKRFGIKPMFPEDACVQMELLGHAFFVFMTNVQAQRITIVDEVLAHHRVNTKTSLSVTREKSWDCCWQAINAIREDLLVRNQYKLVEQSFVNWAVHFLLWNVRTLKDSSKEKLMEEIRAKYSKTLEFASYKPEYFYDKKEYQEFLAICQSGEHAKIQENVFRKTLHYLKENGLKATVHKIKSVLGK